MRVPFSVILTVLLWGFAMAVCPAASRAENHAVIICGSGGNEEFQESFTDLAVRLAATTGTPLAIASSTGSPKPS